MVARREMMGGSLLAGLAALVMPRTVEAAGAVEAVETAVEQQRGSESEVAKAIDELRAVVEVQGSGCGLGQCGPVAMVRQQQKTFMKANRKYPDYIDAGIDAWEAVYDWHVKNRQEIKATRMPDGRYGLVFMFTTIVLREDQVPSYIGWGYDAR